MSEPQPPLIELTSDNFDELRYFVAPEQASLLASLIFDYWQLRRAIATPEVYASVVSEVLEKERDELAQELQQLKQDPHKRLADAAPDLLEACKTTLRLMHSPEEFGDCQPAYGMLRGAVAKAEQLEGKQVEYVAEYHKDFVSHVCGAAGFGHDINDVCPACEEDKKNRDKKQQAFQATRDIFGEALTFGSEDGRLNFRQFYLTVDDWPEPKELHKKRIEWHQRMCEIKPGKVLLLIRKELRETHVQEAEDGFKHDQ